jgi:DNA polymerase-1
MKRVLIVDALNQFIRGYIVDPSLSKNGDPIGGIKGFLKILQKICRETKPDAIVIAWDGEGGSLRRKQSVGEYKEGRNPLRLNRSVRAMSEKEEFENKLWQQMKLFEFLNATPVIQLLFDQVEADDLIAYTCQSEKYRDWQKIIVSSDKDFYQLLDDKTVVMRPIQKEIVNKNDVLEKYDIHPNNFAMARAMSGDPSDNLPGISGVGLKTVAKRFPIMKEEKQYLFDDLVNYSRGLEKKFKVHEVLEDNKELVLLNHHMMQLDAPMLSFQDVQKLKQIFNEASPNFNATEFRKLLLKEGFGEVNFTDLFVTFNKIVRVYKDSA